MTARVLLLIFIFILSLFGKKLSLLGKKLSLFGKQLRLFGKQLNLFWQTFTMVQHDEGTPNWTLKYHNDKSGFIVLEIRELCTVTSMAACEALTAMNIRRFPHCSCNALQLL